MVSKKERHHYVPASYLSGFSDKNDRTGQLYIFDKKELKVFSNTAENVGYIKRYYKIEIDGLDEDLIENLFAQIEQSGKKILLNIIKNKRLPVGEDYNNFIFYIALFGSRVPRVRNIINRGIGNLGTIITKQYFQHAPEKLLMNQLKKAGVKFDDIELEDLKKFALSHKYEGHISQNYQIQLVLIMAKEIFYTLIKRKWYLLQRTNNLSNTFITSDSPMLLMNKDNLSIPAGFELLNTQVIFPLNKDLYLIGDYNKPVDEVCNATNRLIRLYNSFQTIWAERFIYSYTEDFGVVSFNDRRNIGIQDFIQEIKEKIKK